MNIADSYFKAKRRRYASGGNMGQDVMQTAAGADPSGIAGTAMMVGNQLGDLTESIAGTNEYGRVSPAAQSISGLFKSGPIGAISGLMKGFREQKDERKMLAGRRLRQLQADKDYSSARLGADPELQTGSLSAEYFATGGRMKQYGTGGGFDDPKAKNGLRKVTAVPTGYSPDPEYKDAAFPNRTYYKRQTSTATHTTVPITSAPRRPAVGGVSHMRSRPVTGSVNSLDRVYMESNPVATPPAVTPAAAFRGESVFGHDNKLMGMIRYPIKNTTNVAGSEGMLNTGQQNATFMYTKPNSADVDSTRGSYNLDPTAIQKLMGTTNAMDPNVDLSPYAIKATGGSLAASYLGKSVGGKLTSESSNGVSVTGPSHAGGGVNLPQQNAQVEGGETIVGDYVFSKELGFAKLHKPIMKAKGIIEKKPATPERVNAINALNNQENDLMLAQEYFKKIHGIN